MKGRLGGRFWSKAVQFLGILGGRRFLRYSLQKTWRALLPPSHWLNLPSGVPPPLPLTYQIEVSQACNIRCRMCPNAFEKPGATPFLDLDRFIHLFEKLPVRPAHVTLSGIGEPLLAPEFFRIVEFLKERKTVFSFFTNGMLMDDTTRRQLLAQPHLAAVGFSLDSADPDTFARLRPGASLPRIAEQVRKFHEEARWSGHPVRTKINFVISRDNYHEIMNLMEFGESLGCPEFGCFDLIPNDEGMTVPDEIIRAIPTGELIAEGRRRGITVRFSLRGGGAGDRRVRCSMPYDYVFIDVAGNIRPCCMVIPKSRAAFMGNLFRQPFNVIWQGSSYQDFRRRFAAGRNPHCRKCWLYHGKDGSDPGDLDP